MHKEEQIVTICEKYLTMIITCLYVCCHIRSPPCFILVFIYAETKKKIYKKIFQIYEQTPYAEYSYI